jgi:3-dehydroquinate synthase
MSDVLISDALHTRDDIRLPGDPYAIVQASSSRQDAYPIILTRSLADTVAEISRLVGEASTALVTDQLVLSLHGERLLGELRRVGIEPEIFALPPGEEHKSLEHGTRALNWLAESSIGRHDVILNLGGGVPIDLGGWAACCHMRGTRYLNIPTTLIGQVDAGIGGKVAVNHARGKNMIGGFHQPIGVVSYVGFLGTLDDRAIKGGMAETIKKALIASPDYLSFIEDHAEALLGGDLDALGELVCGAGVIKAELIARDPYEYDSRRTLGFGHAIAHPVETVTGFGPITHGEAVAFGMVVEATMARARGMLPTEIYDRVLEVLGRYSLPRCQDELGTRLPGRRLIAAIQPVRLARGGLLRLVFLRDIGVTAIVDDVGDEELRVTLRRLGVHF